MKAAPWPSTAQLAACYHQLQWESGSVTPPDLVRWAQWARVDARLAEILVRYFSEHFSEINPYQLRHNNLQSRLPQALLVLLEFATLLVQDKPRRAEFLLWARMISEAVDKAPWQSFFVPQGISHPEKLLAEHFRSLKPYSRWGFFGSESPISGKTKVRATMMAKPQRMKILENLVERGKPIRVSDYIAACSGNIHRRTAERDLDTHPSLRGRGFTRRKSYFPKSR